MSRRNDEDYVSEVSEEVQDVNSRHVPCPLGVLPYVLRGLPSFLSSIADESTEATDSAVRCPGSLRRNSESDGKVSSAMVG